MNNETPSAATTGASPFQTVINVFLSPREAFQAVDQRPNWVLPFVIMLIIGTVVAVFTVPIAMQDRMDDQRDQLIEERGMTPEEADRAMEIGEKIGKIAGPIIAPIGMGLYLVIVSAVLLFLGNILMGGESNFKKVFSMFSYSSMVGALGSLISLPIIISKQTLEVPTNIAVIIGLEDQGTFAYQLLSKVELFTIWQLIIVSIGMAVIYKFTTKKAATGVVVLWLLAAVVISAITATLTK